jgi:hypothetical protein
VLPSLDVLDVLDSRTSRSCLTEKTSVHVFVVRKVESVFTAASVRLRETD